METLHQGLGPLPALIAGVAGAVVGFLLARLGRSANGDQKRLETELSRISLHAKEQSRQVTKLLGEQRAHANLARALPDVARALNSDNLDERQIPGFVFELVRTIFEPEQACLFLTWSPSVPGRDQTKLHFADAMKPADVPPAAKTIGLGDGRIGWVATNKVEMLPDDWMNKSRTGGRTIEDNHPSIRFELLAPLVQHDGKGARLLGVLGIRGPACQPSNPKLMLTMITNLATIAYTNSRNTVKLRDLADHDGLTGLLNKRKFMGERLALLINAAEKEAAPLTVFIFDIDHFKKYNDTYGHLAGDEILKQVSDVLRNNLRAGDVACRYGGEEFIVAMPGVGGAECLTAADRIRAAIQGNAFTVGSGAPEAGRITISGGVTQFPVDGTDGQDLIRRADEALYQAKGAGRNRVFRFRGVEIGGDVRDDAPWSPHADLYGDR